MTECTHENILSSSDICYFTAHGDCADKASYFNFIHFYYCTIDQSIAVILFASLFFGLIVFNFLGAIADSYLAPSLEIVAKKLRLSETVAGITLLAFAASAPDVVTGIVAGGRAEEGLKIAVGGLFGACLFTVTMVLAGCIRGAKRIEAEKKALTRDVTFLFASVLYFVLLAILNEVTPLLASGFFVLYIVFFGYILYNEKVKSKKTQIGTNKESMLVLEIEQPEISNIEEYKPIPPTFEKFRRAQTDLKLTNPIIPSLNLRTGVKSDDAIPPPTEMNMSSLKIRYRSSWRRMASERSFMTKPKHLSHFAQMKNINSETVSGDALILESKQDEEISQLSDLDEEKQGFIHKTFKYINIPILFLGDLTMPPFESSRWNLYMAIFTPILGPLLIIWELGLLAMFDADWYLWIVCGTISLILAAIILFGGKKRNLAEHYPGVFATITLIVSIFWLNLVSSLIVDFLSFVQVLTNVSLYFLSITLLAWGNSLEDYFVNYAIAKKGFGRTALGGIYGSQIFAIMIGFGGGLFRSALSSNEPLRLDIFNLDLANLRSNLTIIFLLAATLLVLIMTLIMGRMSKWILGRKVITFALAFYGVFAVGVTLLTFA